MEAIHVVGHFNDDGLNRLTATLASSFLSKNSGLNISPIQKNRDSEFEFIVFVERRDKSSTECHFEVLDVSDKLKSAGFNACRVIRVDQEWQMSVENDKKALLKYLKEKADSLQTLVNLVESL